VRSCHCLKKETVVGEDTGGNSLPCVETCVRQLTGHWHADRWAKPGRRSLSPGGRSRWGREGSLHRIRCGWPRSGCGGDFHAHAVHARAGSGDDRGMNSHGILTACSSDGHFRPHRSRSLGRCMGRCVLCCRRSARALCSRFCVVV
jgi:hypothetical protein